MKVSSELPPPSRESNGKRSRQSSRSESTHSNRKGSSIRSSRAINKADPLDILKAENDKDIYLTFDHMETDLHAVIRCGILQDIHKKYITWQLLKALKYVLRYPPPSLSLDHDTHESPT